MPSKLAFYLQAHTLFPFLDYLVFGLGSPPERGDGVSLPVSPRWGRYEMPRGADLEQNWRVWDGDGWKEAGCGA